MDNQPLIGLAEIIKEIFILMEYNAPGEEADALKEVLGRYEGDAIAINLFHHFYSYLPEAREDGIISINRVASRDGAFLFCVNTLYNHYLYLATRDSMACLGPFDQTIEDQDLLEFFGWDNDEEFRNAVGNPEEQEEHLPVNDSLDLCPVCGTGDGEFHAFGCPVEICPWCGGQITNCECRFIKTGRDQLSRESHLDELLAILEDTGRVPYSAERHRPSFMNEEKLD